VEVIQVSSEKVGGSSSGAKRPAPEEAQVQGQEEAKVNSSEQAGATTSDAVRFSKNFGDPSDLVSTPKAYSHKFFNKLIEVEKWDLEQDFLNSMLNNAWGKADAVSSEIQNFKKEIEQLCDKLLVNRKVPPSSPQVSRRKLARVSTWILRVDYTEDFFKVM
jgi:hypothetical protein